MIRLHFDVLQDRRKERKLNEEAAKSDHEEMDFDIMDSKIGFLSCYFRVGRLLRNM